MNARLLAAVLASVALAASGCGPKNVDTATYTCGQFSKSLDKKGDNSAGNYINQLRKKARLGQAKQTERREITLGILFACRGKPASTKPANAAIATAKKIRAGTVKPPAPTAGTKKKSTK